MPPTAFRGSPEPGTHHPHDQAAHPQATRPAPDEQAAGHRLADREQDQLASDQAEGMRMPSRIGEDPPPIFTRLVIRLARAQLQQPGLGLVQVLDREVEVELQGNSLVRPARSPVVVDPLKADEESVLTAETGEVGV